MRANIPLAALQDNRGSAFPNHLKDVDFGYAEEAALFADIKALKARVAAHCVNSDRKKFTTQTTAFLRDIVQHLPENPMQVPGARSSILANLAPGNLSAQTPAHTFHQDDVKLRAHEARSLVLGNHPAPAIFTAPSTPSPASARVHRTAMLDCESPLSIPRGTKRAREDALDGSPRSRSSPSSITASCNNTPEPSPQKRCTSTPRGHRSYPEFNLGPPETPSPRKSARQTPGAAYLNGNFRARRSLPRGQRHSGRESILSSGPLGLDEDEIPRFLGRL
ncbi:hypothetical protein K438DRAFT_1946575 [Mycena galopus ATCC 62051]|nr:hypothetical protein K438DRAFT_1946575 [Mycena galopus ATCC 62051]